VQVRVLFWAQIEKANRLL